MKSGKFWSFRWAVMLAALGLDTSAQIPQELNHYTLLPGSSLMDDCLICGRPSFSVPMKGAFELRLVQDNGFFRSYALENISFTAGPTSGPNYRIVGQGTFEIGGEVALVQKMALEVLIDDGRTNRLCYFTNSEATVDRLWPMLHLTLAQTNGTLLQTYTLELSAAPLRDLWFSTSHALTAGQWKPPTNSVSAGALLSLKGNIVRKNEELTRHLGIMPGVPDLGLDAVDVLSGGEILFSIEQDVFSETLGPLQHGDLLSMRGRIVARNQDLTKAFGLAAPVPDVGLDAVQVMTNGDIYFSIETPISTGKGLRLGRGDLLSNSGLIVRSNAQLLARFQPTNPGADYGLDAVYVWPSGEIWFSTEQGFSGPHSEPYLAGDLLSDQGYVVYRNLDLVSGFAPVEDLADFGLDAVFVVLGAPPRMDVSRSGSGLRVSWDAPDGILQHTDSLTNPWTDVSPQPSGSPYDVPSPVGTKVFRLRTE